MRILIEIENCMVKQVAIDDQNKADTVIVIDHDRMQSHPGASPTTFTKPLLLSQHDMTNYLRHWGVEP